MDAAVGFKRTYPGYILACSIGRGLRKHAGYCRDGYRLQEGFDDSPRAPAVRGRA